jgi:hypothetical protein
MDTSELLRRAWEAVEASGVPEPLREAAFKAAVEDLRASEDAGASAANVRQEKDRSQRGKSRDDASTGQTPVTVDEGTFFSQLAEESDVPEDELRDILRLSQGKVLVTQATRKLGSVKAEQARTVVALVATARAFGLGESPVNADAVREELKRKNLYDAGNFSAQHLGRLGGFNFGGSSKEIVTTSKWLDDFKAAVNRALGRTDDDDE